MTRFSYLFVVLFFVSGYSFSEETAFIAPLAKDSVALDIATTGDFSVVVGERGHVLIAKGEGDFQQVQVPTQSTLTSVAIVEQHIWAAGHDSVILHSADAGKTWGVQYFDSSLEKPVLDMIFIDENHGFAIGAYGLFLRTVNGGETWVIERHAELLDPLDQEYLEDVRKESEEYYIQELDSILPHLNRISKHNGQLLMAGESGLLAVSDDSGKTWKRFETNYYGSFFDVKAVVGNDSNGILAVGLRGSAFYSEDGVQWDRIQTCSTSTLNSLLHLPNGDMLAMGNNGTLLNMSFPINEALNSNTESCDQSKAVKLSQTKDKNAILNAVYHANTVIAATAGGIRPLTLR
ncbi:hypothetical protein J3L16_04920 [Alteromonas sp. 5E99-2]|uniref:YCF48-related protein n=1 Tax=Alteromonas sp. 5E99-2 TaxID=2817683 RepID=UPI001A98726C|nr:YCF48-related protein [Alteromonas sp. 5E99-2]MBO1255030.1 hypothetical protein [Alteromonas sp. 5E99-2]